MNREFGHEKIFDAVMESIAWGGKESLSGRGSDLDQTYYISRKLPDLFNEFGVKTLLDLPCGDFHWMEFVDLTGIDYLGCDVSNALIETNKQAFAAEGIRFTTLNIIADKIPTVDLILNRDLLGHFSYADIRKAIVNLVESGSKYLVTTTFPGRDRNVDIHTGGWRPLNLEESPFLFPRPTLYLVERCTEGNGLFRDKSLGLWIIETLKPLIN